MAERLKEVNEIRANIPELVQYITWLASEREEMLSPIRLVKFLRKRGHP